MFRKAVRKTLEELKRTMPDGIEYVIALDTTDFVRLSIEEVIHTLFEAILLVVLVVYLFLQSFRATIICTVAIFVALIGTFPGMLALGFSINLLTLFGIVLAIGMVVDDAIVVVENVERNMVKFHLPPREATIQAMEQIGTSLIAVVLVMASVFIPAAFLPGTTGQLYKQFAITIVISVALSGFVALTLTPAMCGLMLKHTTPPQRGLFAWFNRQFDRFTLAFGDAVVFMIKRMGVAFVLLAVLIVGSRAPVPDHPDELCAQRRSGLCDGPVRYARRREPEPHLPGIRPGGQAVRRESGGGQHGPSSTATA